MHQRNRLLLIIAILALLAGFFLLVSFSAHTSANPSTIEITPTVYAYMPLVPGQPIPMPTQTPTPPGTSWLSYVNYYREMADLPAVAENQSWSYGNWLHGRYIVKNDVVEHTEDTSNPWYTEEGLAAARASNLVGHGAVDATDEWAIDAWMQAPFHAVGVLDPQLLSVGYGSYREADGGLQMGAGLDVIRGMGNNPGTVALPVKWPSDGASVPLTMHWGEYPSPLTSCPGYSSPSGLPIILQIGFGDVVPDVTSHSFAQGSTPLEHCVFDETDYSNPDGARQGLGRGILNARDAIVLIPRNTLTAGATYAVSITVNGQTHTWSFTVSSTARIASKANLGLAPALDSTHSSVE